jgi:FkbM family methyltransferase
MRSGEPEPYFRFRVTPGFFAHLFKAVVKQHHRPLAPMLRRVIPEDGIVFDVGAHAGQFSKLFAKLAPKGFVYSFEPGTYARTILRVGIRANRLRNIMILPFALGARSGVAILRVPVKASGSYGFGLSHIGAPDRPGEREAVAMTTLDEAAEALGLTRLDFIKADIEGYELQLIKGATQTLARLRPALLLEVDPGRLTRAGDSMEALWNALLSAGYRPAEPTPEQTPIAAPRGGDVLFLPPT